MISYPPPRITSATDDLDAIEAILLWCQGVRDQAEAVMKQHPPTTAASAEARVWLSRTMRVGSFAQERLASGDHEGAARWLAGHLDEFPEVKRVSNARPTG